MPITSQEKYGLSISNNTIIIRFRARDYSKGTMGLLEHTGCKDIFLSLKELSLPFLLAKADIRQKYRRSSLGPFWITISTGVMIACIGLIFGGLFKSPTEDFLPFLTAGLIFWTFISNCLLDATQVFVNSEAIIKQLPIPLFSHVLRMVIRNFYILLHNILIFPIVIRQSERVSEFSGILSVPELSTGNSELLSVTGMLPTVKTSEQKRPDKKKEKHSLVLVERNKDLCNYLVQILMKEYKIVSVCDVEAAFETVCEQCPDAVLASSVLTRISGEELAVRIKSDDRVAHIPVILLVKPGEDDRYIQRNADLYVWMPFAISSLKTEIAALIANREMIRKRYIRLALGGEASDPIDKEVESSEGDQEFIRQVRSLIEERMTDSGFKIGELSDCMNMSRSSFYNKIKEITGHAPADYVRNVRLNRALVLLMSRKYTVAEVADMTGFSDPKYFGIVFKKYYGGSPTKYINNL